MHSLSFGEGMRVTLIKTIECILLIMASHAFQLT